MQAQSCIFPALVFISSISPYGRVSLPDFTIYLCKLTNKKPQSTWENRSSACCYPLHCKSSDFQQFYCTIPHCPAKSNFFCNFPPKIAEIVQFYKKQLRLPPVFSAFSTIRLGKTGSLSNFSVKFTTYSVVSPGFFWLFYQLRLVSPSPNCGFFALRPHLRVSFGVKCF